MRNEISPACGKMHHSCDIMPERTPTSALSRQVITSSIVHHMANSPADVSVINLAVLDHDEPKTSKSVSNVSSIHMRS